MQQVYKMDDDCLYAEGYDLLKEMEPIKKVYKAFCGSDQCALPPEINNRLNEKGIGYKERFTYIKEARKTDVTCPRCSHVLFWADFREMMRKITRYETLENRKALKKEEELLYKTVSNFKNKHTRKLTTQTANAMLRKYRGRVLTSPEKKNLKRTINRMLKRLYPTHVLVLSKEELHSYLKKVNSPALRLLDLFSQL